MPEKNYLNEIEEILRKAEADGRSRTRRPRLSVPRCLRGFSLSWPTITPGKALVTGIALLLLALVFRPFLSAATTPLIWASLGMFVVAYVLFLLNPRAARYEKRWRGQVIEDGQQDSPWKRIRRLLRGK